MQCLSTRARRRVPAVTAVSRPALRRPSRPPVPLTTYAFWMPSTVSSLFDAVGVEPTGCVPWGMAVPEMSTGVYVVALTSAADARDGMYPDAPVDGSALDELCAVCPTLTLDGMRRPAREQLAERIGSYWLPDEVVLYIGLARQPLRTRVRQYYNTPLGAAKPHKGGWWLKTLSVLAELQCPLRRRGGLQGRRGGHVAYVRRQRLRRHPLATAR